MNALCQTLLCRECNIQWTCLQMTNFFVLQPCKYIKYFRLNAKQYPTTTKPVYLYVHSIRWYLTVSNWQLIFHSCSNLLYWQLYILRGYLASTTPTFIASLFAKLVRCNGIICTKLWATIVTMNNGKGYHFSHSCNTSNRMLRNLPTTTFSPNKDTKSCISFVGLNSGLSQFSYKDLQPPSN